MINKIYKKFTNFIHNNWKFLIIVILTLILALYPVDCYIITGGGIIKASDRVEIVGSKKEKGSLNLAYVSELKATLATYLLSYIIPSFEIEKSEDVKFDSSESFEDVDFRNNILLKQANNHSIYVAYKSAGKEIKEKNKKLYVYYISKEADTDLKVGDQILEINGIKINDYDELTMAINTLKENDTISIKIKRNNKEETRTAKLYKKDDKLVIGIVLMNDIEYNVKPKLKLIFKNGEGGPSGGLMMSLEIYNQLTEKDITKGKKIVGTGTIDIDGTVGEIDGVKYKLKGAVKNKADIFIVPAGKNYKEAQKEKKKNNYNIKIIKAETFEQVISELNKIK